MLFVKYSNYELVNKTLMVMMMKTFQIEKNSEKKNIHDPKGKKKKVQDERLNVLLRDNTPKTQKYSLGYQRQHPKVQKTLTRVVKRQNPKTQKYSPG
jgi:hypothetical protein